MRRKRKIVIVTRDYRLTIEDVPCTARIETADGVDAMGVKRWRFIPDDKVNAALLNDIVRDVASNLLNRKKRRNRKS